MYTILSSRFMYIFFYLFVDAIVLIRIRHATQRARHDNILICYQFIELLPLGFRFFVVRLSTTNIASGTGQQNRREHRLWCTQMKTRKIPYGAGFCLNTVSISVINRNQSATFGSM